MATVQIPALKMIREFFGCCCFLSDRRLMLLDRYFQLGRQLHNSQSCLQELSRRARYHCLPFCHREELPEGEEAQ